MSNLWLLTPFVSIAVFGLLVAPVGLIGRGKSPIGVAGYAGLAGLVIAMVSTIWLGFRGGPSVSFGGFEVDLFTYFFTGVLVLVSLFVAISSFDYMKGDPNTAPYFGLLLLSTLGMIVLAASMDLILLYVGWELMSVPTYALTAIRKKDPNSNEAAMKFFVLSALSSALIVYAISLTFGVTGSTNLVAIASSLRTIGSDTRSFALIAIVLFVAGFGVKMAVVPFHMWIPDAFEGAPTTVTALLASGAKMAAFAAAFRVFIVGIWAINVDFYSTFAIVAIATMTLGNVAALMQKSFTRLLAYSSIAQAGYVLIALATPTTTTMSPLGLAGGLFQVLNYSIVKTGAFIAAAAVSTKLAVNTLDSFNGLGRRMPQTAFNITIFFLALAGVPPLNGFFSKVMLFTGAVYSPFSWGGYLAVTALINSGFSMSYYGWIIKRMYFDDPADSSKIYEPKAYTSVMWIATVLVFIIGIYPDPWIRLVQGLAGSLVGLRNA
ncbi:MAG TPA: NADH-quinone oxidoreductase subunit N [Candidatus Bathyarchaeia archaeon]|nr:NADH-quinone oxidoreductase subunit N [Candidatus Bathyarchaeia archaeon]